MCSDGTAVEKMNEMVKTDEALEQALKEQQAAREHVEESLKQMLSTKQAAKEPATEAAPAATVVPEATEHRMNTKQAAKEATQMHLDASHQIRAELRKERSAREEAAQVQAAATEKKWVEM